MEQVMGECLDKKIRVVANAGGLNPKGLAAELARIAETLGLHPKIAYIEGDDLMGRLGELQAMGEDFIHMDKGITLKDSQAMTISPTPTWGAGGS